MPARREHIPSLAAAFRDYDLETTAALGKTPEQALHEALAGAARAEAAVDDDRTIAMWGASVDNFMAPTRAHMWFTMAKDFQRPAHRIARIAQVFVADARSRYGPLLTTVVGTHSGDDRWVRWMGFSPAPEHDHCVGGVLFRAYWRG